MATPHPDHRPLPSRPTITVIVLAHQHAAYIRRCLDSILEQQVQAELRVLIGDDASTDGTAGICSEYAHDPRVTLVARGPEHRKIIIDGTTTGRALLLHLMARAEGDLVIRIDGDDHWCDPLKLQVQLEALRSHPEAAGCYHATQRIHENGAPTGKLMQEHLPERIVYTDMFAPLAPFHISSFLYHNRSYASQLPSLAERVGSLDLLLFAIVAHAGPLVRVEGAMSCYRMHQGGITRSEMFARSNILRSRILLWTGVVQLFRGDGRTACDRVCDMHLQTALREPITPLDAWRWIKALLQRPGFFLRERRWRTVLSLVGKGWRN